MSPADGRNNQTYDAAAVVVESLADGPLSGYQIARASGGRVVGHSQKWLYPLLYDLEGRGAISGEWRVTPTGMRRCYSLRGAAVSRFAV
jgi:DNA-binding PadR family transcriptional regulator